MDSNRAKVTLFCEVALGRARPERRPACVGRVLPRGPGRGARRAARAAGAGPAAGAAAGYSGPSSGFVAQNLE